MTRSAGCLLLVLTWLVVARPARGWILSEHEAITADAVALVKANPDTQAAWNQYFSPEVRQLLLCPRDAPGDCLPFAALPALAGDHSCQPTELATALRHRHASDNRWIDEVLEVARETDRELREAAENAPRREQLRRQMHIELHGVDERYLLRALKDFSHFQLPRESGDMGSAGLAAYLETALNPSQLANATASYVNYHGAALRWAASVSSGVDRAEQDRRMARAFLLETFALHFLEDSFAAGHFVGHWGSDGVRLGTHDFYSRAGIEAVRWGDPSTSFYAHGDAFLSDSERAVAAAAVATSLGQLLRAAGGADPTGVNTPGLEEYDSCRAETAPPELRSLIGSALLWEVLRFVPVPSTRYPETPRVRAEKGVFLGVASTFQGGLAFPEKAGQLGVLAGARLGYGAADLVNDPINAQAFVEVGVAGQRVFTKQDDASLLGLAIRVRGPGNLLFLDGWVLIAAAELSKARCGKCVRWAANAAGGGAFGIWKARHLFDHVYGQVSLLRDVSLLLFPGEPVTGEHRYQVLLPALSARSALPIKGGSGIAQSTDFYLDVGLSLTWDSHDDGTVPGAFTSLSIAPRIFL